MIRPATHAGTWYDKSSSQLRAKVDLWLSEAEKNCSLSKQARHYAIGPHAGYRFCGPVLAHTYAQVDPTVEQIVLMGPSHFKYFRGIKTTSFDKFSTPLGDLDVDQDALSRLSTKCNLTALDTPTDFKEHSWEMHLPFIASVLPNVKIVPLLLGAFDKSQTAKLVSELALMLDNPKTAVIVSSDFCHWGSYFDYTPFSSEAPLIYKHIEVLDHDGIALLTAGTSSHAWQEYIERTGNTICGALPIRLMLLIAEKRGEVLKFNELAYSQSSTVRSIEDSSVSYAALAA